MKLIFDIGGTSTKVGILDNDHKIVRKDVINYLEPMISWDSLKKIISKYIKEILLEINIQQISISCPGAINFKTGEVIGNSAIKGLIGHNPKTYFENEFNIPTYIDNDANCAAIAELKLGTAKTVENALLCVIGTGVGGAMIVNNKIYRGSNYFAGEYGTMYESELPMFLRGKSTMKYKCTSFYGLYFACLWYQYLTKEKKTGKDLYDSYRTDLSAKKVINEMIYGISKTISNLSLVIDPQLVIIGGAISENDMFIEKLSEQTTKFYQTKFNLKQNFNITKSKFGNDANIIGASFLDEE